MLNSKHVFVFIGVALLLAGGVSCHSNPAPSRPAVVPSQAVWVGGGDGGSFIQCDTDTKDNVNRCLAYNEFTGDVEAGGDYQLQGQARAATAAELQFQSFDGINIGLTNGTLTPVSPITPDGVPAGTVFANGLFFSCGGLHAGIVACSIYRPDGQLYFAGNFAYRSVGGNPAPALPGIKYFSLSDHTIYLVNGDQLVAQ